MAGVTYSVALEGVIGRPVEIEVDVSSGMPGTIMVGLGDTIVSEARERVRAAVINSSVPWPEHRVTINLAPSTLPKTGSHYDLAIALAVCASKKTVDSALLAKTAYVGELALDGRLRAVRGVLPATLAAADAGFETIVVPEVNSAEARLVPGIAVIGARSLRHCLAMLSGEPDPDDPEVPALPDSFQDATQGSAWRTSVQGASLDLADVAGQEDSRIAVIVAAAGGHHLLMSGPPGIGKTMLAHRLPGLLPDLEHREALEVSAIHSLAGVLPAAMPLVTRPPFVDPHHTATAVAIVGGGSRGIKPGALSVAHRGVLFLDEAPEFASNVLDSLRQPLESGQVVVSRSAETARFPARFQLVLAANPCPCGQGGSMAEQCDCTPLMRRRYRDRISGPVRDRIDIHRVLVAPTRPELSNLLGSGRSTAELGPIVAQARARQAARLRDTPWQLNTDVPGVELRKRWPAGDAGRTLLDTQLTAQRLTARSADRILRVAWTIADLREHDRPTGDDVELALALRRGTPLGSGLRDLAGGLGS